MLTVEEWLHLEFWSAGVFGMRHSFYIVFPLVDIDLFAVFGATCVLYDHCKDVLLLHEIARLIFTDPQRSRSATRLPLFGYEFWLATVSTILIGGMTIQKKPKWNLVQYLLLIVRVYSHSSSIIAIERIFNRAVMEEMRCTCEIIPELIITDYN